MRKLLQFLRVIWAALTVYYSLRKGSKKLLKWLKKNEKAQDDSLHDFNKRWDYFYKRVKKVLRKLGIKVTVIGIENLPKGTFWMTPNHTSNLDGFYLMAAVGQKVQISPVAKESLKTSRLTKGYFYSSDTFFIDRDNLRQSIAVLNNAAQYAKQTSRGVCVFPEGARSFSTELLEFKSGSFKFPQKYFLPIVPVTIMGTLQAKRWWKLTPRRVIVKIDPILKPSEHSTLDSIKVAERVKKIIKNNLDKYYESLTPSMKKEFNYLKKKGNDKFEKLQIKVQKKKLKKSKKTSDKFIEEPTQMLPPKTNVSNDVYQIEDFKNQQNSKDIKNIEKLESKIELDANFVPKTPEDYKEDNNLDIVE